MPIPAQMPGQIVSKDRRNLMKYIREGNSDAAKRGAAVQRRLATMDSVKK